MLGIKYVALANASTVHTATALLTTSALNYKFTHRNYRYILGVNTQFIFIIQLTHVPRTEFMEVFKST